MGMCVSKVQETKTYELHVMQSPEKDNSTFVGDTPITGVELASRRLPCHPVTNVHGHGSKEEFFFDSQPWLNSDSEDDFLSVRGDFTPSHGSTPVHSNFSPQITSSLNKFLFDENLLGLNSEQASTGKKKSLVELFRDSIRIIDHPDTDEQNGPTKNNDFEVKRRSKKLYARCCIPRILTG